MREMDAKYLGLRELLEDPYGSLYLQDGMYQLAIQFLQDRMVPPREDIFIFGLDTKNSLEDAYIMAVFERLLPHCNTTEPGMFLGGLETVIMDHGLNNGADAHYLNAAMIAVLRKECGDYAKLVKQGGYYKWQEENKLFLNWLAETTNTLAYAALAYSAMKNYEKRSNDQVAVKEEQAKNSGSGKGEVGNEGAGKTMPKDFLDDALKQQGLKNAPNGLKQTWTENGYKYEVRIHGGESQYTDSSSIYRVSRQISGQGTEYLGTDGNWYHTSVLTEVFRDGRLNPLYNETAAKMTHIPLP